MDPGAKLGGVPGGGGIESQDKKIKLAGRELRVIGNERIKSYESGENGAELEDVLSHCENELGEGHSLVGEEFLADLNADHIKIEKLMADLGETRDRVAIVAQTADGFTRLFLSKQPDGHYKKMDGKEDSKDRFKGHRQDEDLFVFEKGMARMAA